MGLEVTYINGKRCYGFEKGNRFFFMKGIEYELLGAASIEGDTSWTGVMHRFKKRFPGPDDDKARGSRGTPRRLKGQAIN